MSNNDGRSTVSRDAILTTTLATILGSVFGQEHVAMVRETTMARAESSFLVPSRSFAVPSPFLRRSRLPSSVRLYVDLSHFMAPSAKIHRVASSSVAKRKRATCSPTDGESSNSCLFQLGISPVGSQRRTNVAESHQERPRHRYHPTFPSPLLFLLFHFSFRLRLFFPTIRCTTTKKTNEK